MWRDLMEKKSMKWNLSRFIVMSLLVVMAFILNNGSKVNAQSADTPGVIRHEGYSRENVAENVAKTHFGDSKKVILVNREKFPDAISATNISQGRYPVLYTYQGRVTDGTIELLQSMSIEEIYILGGELSIKPSVVNQLKNETGVKVTRVAGRSRYDANVEAVKEDFTQANHVVIASGEVYSDALYGVSYANTINAPVILSNTNRLEASTVNLLKKLGVKQATIIGGELTVTSNVVSQLSNLGIESKRIAGRNRYIGSAEVASESYQNPTNIVVASGEIFSDALVSAPLAQKLNAPILLVRSVHMEEAVENYLKNHSSKIENVYIQGGPVSVTHSLETNIEYFVIPHEFETHSVVNDIPYETITVEDSTKDRNYIELKQKGETGRIEIRLSRYRYHDGTVFEEKSEEMIKNPVDKIIFYGTKGLSSTGPTQGYTIVDQIDNEGHKHHQANISQFHINSEIDLLDLIELKETDQALIDERAKDNTLTNTYTLSKDVFGFQEGPFPIQLSQESIDLVHSHLMDVSKVNEIYLSLVNEERERMGKEFTTIDYNLAQGAQKRTMRYKPYMGILNKPRLRGNKEWYEDFNYLNNPEINTHYAEHLYESIYSFSYKGNPYVLASEKYLAESLFEERMKHFYSSEIMGNPYPFYIDFQLFNSTSLWNLTDDFTVTIIRDYN